MFRNQIKSFRTAYIDFVKQSYSYGKFSFQQVKSISGLFSQQKIRSDYVINLKRRNVVICLIINKRLLNCLQTMNFTQYDVLNKSSDMLVFVNENKFTIIDVLLKVVCIQMQKYIRLSFMSKKHNKSLCNFIFSYYASL